MESNEIPNIHTSCESVEQSLREKLRLANNAFEPLVKLNKELQQQLSQSQERCEKLEAALRELVSLKDTKDNMGRTGDYLQRQPKAWEAAKQLLTTK